MFPHTTKILIVEDDSGPRALIHGFLKELGYPDVEEATDGAQAFECLEKALAAGKPFGLVTSDLNMKPISGKDLLAKVRSNSALKTVPFIMLTSDGKLQSVVEAVSSGVNDYIVKPIDKQMLE